MSESQIRASRVEPTLDKTQQTSYTMTNNTTINTTTSQSWRYEMTDALVKELELEATRSTFNKFMNAYKMNNADLAAALQVDRRTIQRYRSGDSYPTRRVRHSLADLREISFLLDEIFVNQEAAIRWLNISVPLLKGRRPIDLIQKGKLDDVIKALETYESGAFL